MQSQKRSLLEVICNTGSGIIAALLTWKLIVLPWVHLLDADLATLSIVGILLMNGAFTIVSVVRGWAWRRLFNKYD
jgi:hypothetical protein